MNERLRLSATPSTGMRAFGVVFGLVFAGIAALITGTGVVMSAAWQVLHSESPCVLEGISVSDLPPELADECSSATPSWNAATLLPFALAVLIGIPFLLLGLGIALRSLRRAAWLDTTTLLVRGALRTRAVDLSTAELSIDLLTHTNDHGHQVGPRTPVLQARDPGSGRTVKLPLRLPGFELRALADAMTAGRGTLGRDQDAHVIAGQLRQLADNPLELRR